MPINDREESTPLNIIASWLSFLLVSLAAGKLGIFFPRYLSLPLITGYLAVGALSGPYGMELLHLADVHRLGYVTQFALAFICFSAGAELYLPELRTLFRSIVFMVGGIAIVTSVVSVFLFLALASANIIPFMHEIEDMGCRASIAGIAASIMVARSPASAIAVLKEVKGKGPFCNTALACTVMCDVVVLLLFTLTTTIAESECKGEGFSAISLGIMAACILGSLLAGAVLGRFLVFLMWIKRFTWARYFILPLGLIIFVCCHELTNWSAVSLPYVVNLEPLLICIMAGYVCTNTSRHRGRFIGVLHAAAPYVFLPFFTLTGAQLNLYVMPEAFGMAAIVVLARIFSIFVGSSIGGCLAGQSKQHSLHMWMTMITQAGVSLGLASEVGMSYPGWGRHFQTSIIAIVVINQVIPTCPPAHPPRSWHTCVVHSHRPPSITEEQFASPIPPGAAGDQRSIAALRQVVRASLQILGPIFFKLAVRRVGEAGKDTGNGHLHHDEDDALPTAVVLGDTPNAVAQAVRLLNQHWRVVLVAPHEAAAKSARDKIKQYVDATLEDEARERGENIVTTVMSAATDTVIGGVDTVKGGIRALKENIESVPLASAAAESGAAHSVSIPERAKRLDDFLEVVPLLDDDAAETNPFLSDAVALESLGAAAGSGAALPYEKLLALISSTSSLQAFAVALGTDATCFAAARLLVDAVAAAPKRSHLHGARVSVMVHNSGWTQMYSAIGGGSLIPIYAPGTCAHMAACVLIARVGGKPTPVPAFPPAANKDELATNVAAATMERPAYVRLLHGGLESQDALPQPAQDWLEQHQSASADGVKSWLKKSSSIMLSSSFTTAQSFLSLGTAHAEAVPLHARDELLSNLNMLSDDGSTEAPSWLAEETHSRLTLDMYGGLAMPRDEETEHDS
jgi:Kef-type K+ transport system membrane component KefB